MLLPFIEPDPIEPFPAFRAIEDSLLLPSFFARAAPPLRPSATAAAFLPSSVIVSSASPVARMTWTALPITSAWRFWL
jgi:hypothetical protein